MSLPTADKISTWMGAPPDRWTKPEITQMKNVHRRYRDAYEEVRFAKAENLSNTEDGDVKRRVSDLENFLPNDSALRSVGGKKEVPAQGFKDYDEFINSCDVDYWKRYFDCGSMDRRFWQMAKTIVDNICKAQTSHELRVHNGQVPLRKKREHITQLALVLHEIKMWAANQVRNANPVYKDTYLDLKCRARYLDSLAEKEVWGDAANTFEQGMSSGSQRTLVRLFVSLSEDLLETQQYAYRGYYRRSSRMSLQKIGDLLKSILTDEMRRISVGVIVEHNLEDPHTARLQPIELINNLDNQTYVDYKNFVNVLLYKLVQNPLVRGSLCGNFDDIDTNEVMNMLSSWNEDNLFWKPSSDVGSPPELKMKNPVESSMMPEIYDPTVEELNLAIRASNVDIPFADAGKTILRRLKKAYGSTALVTKIVELVMKYAGALQDLVPCMVVTDYARILAGNCGDSGFYDTMRDHVIHLMDTTIERVQLLRESSSRFLSEIKELSENKWKAMRLAAIQKGEMKSKPAWISNSAFIQANYITRNNSNYDTTLSKILEVAKDAKEYSLNTDELTDRHVEFMEMIELVTGFSSEDAQPGTDDCHITRYM